MAMLASGLTFMFKINTMLLPKISLIINMLVLIPVCSGLLLNANWVTEAFGVQSPARGILLSVYLAILISSAFLLFNFDARYVVALLSVQIIYKLLSPIMVGTLANPVVISNILIALFHALTVWKISLTEKILP